MGIVTISNRFHIVKSFVSRDNVWLANGSSDRDKGRHALDLYQSASEGIPWSPGDACKLVYSSFPSRQATLQLVEGGCGLTRLSYDVQQLP